jgi:hypothetical protein
VNELSPIQEPKWKCRRETVSAANVRRYSPEQFRKALAGVMKEIAPM